MQRALVQQYSDAPDKVEVVKVSVRMQFVCEMMHVSLGQELGERVKHTKRLHLRLTKAIYHPISDFTKVASPRYEYMMM